MNLREINPDKPYPMDELYTYVSMRDKDLCQVCGVAGCELHHILYKSQGGKDVPNNLVMLCNLCHHKEHSVKAMGRDYYEERVVANEKRLRERLV